MVGPLRRLAGRPRRLGRDLLRLLAGAIVIRRSGQSVRLFADAVAPGLLVAQGVARLGNAFNQELFRQADQIYRGA